MELVKLQSYTIREVKQTDTKQGNGQDLTITLAMSTIPASLARTTLQQLYIGALAIITDPSPNVRDLYPGKTIFAVVDANMSSTLEGGGTMVLNDGRSPIYLSPDGQGRYDVIDRATDEVMASGLSLAAAKWEQGYHMGHRDAEAGR